MEEWVAALERPEAYRDEDGPLVHIQTHLSHVFLGARRVYKLRKPVRFGFVDFSSLALRAADCAREIELNRRLAPSVYVGVSRIVQEADGDVRVGPIEEQPDDHSEWFVVMRRLPEGGDLQSRLEAGELPVEELVQVAEQLAAFHCEHRLAPDESPRDDEWLDSVTRPVRASFDELESWPGFAASSSLRARFDERAKALETVFAQRRRAGLAVEGHGDLRLEHLWRDDEGRIQVIDCVEFDEGLRRIDAASDIAFLSMDLRHRGRADFAERLLESYAGYTDDWGLFEVIGYFEAYRALVRAKVAALRARDEDVPAVTRLAASKSVDAHLALADSLIEPGDVNRLAVVVCGAIGTGKSTAARALCERLPAISIASDRVRRHVVRAGERADRYDDAAKNAVYQAIFERAGRVSAGGRVPVLDASFSRAGWRADALSWGLERGLRVLAVETHCDPAVAKARVAERQRRGVDPSEAGPELMDAAFAAWQEPDEWPRADFVRIDMGSDDWRAKLDEFLEQLDSRATEPNLRGPKNGPR